jgi:beta-mannosidase
MTLPSNWNRAGLDNYSGTIWFRRCFEISNLEQFLGAKLLFKGVDYYADVYLNDRYLGHHEGYFQPFDFDVRHHLREGENSLTLKVRSPWEETGDQGWPTHKRLIKGVLNHHDCRPGGSNPQRGQEQNTGGIWNDVHLTLFESVRIEQPKFQTSVGDHTAITTVQHRMENYSAEPITLDLSVWVSMKTSKKPITIELQEHRVIVPPGGSCFSTTFTIDQPKLWSSWDQGEPHMYDYMLSASFDNGNVQTVHERFGICDVKMDEELRVWVNGRSVFLRGTNVIPSQWLGEYTQENIDRDIRLLKEANVNCVRVHGHVQREEFYRACDEAGIMVWSDFALQWGYVGDAAFCESAIRQVKDWVRILRKHPSIIAWCCHNEPTGAGRELTPLLARAARQEDSTRPVFEASDFRQHAYPGWYAGQTADFTKLPGAPLVTEYGAQALPDESSLTDMLPDEAWWPETPEQWEHWVFHNFQIDQTFNVAKVAKGTNLTDFVKNSQTYQAKLLQFATEYYRCHKWRGVTGIFQFMFMDPWPSISWSVLDHARKPKLGYATLKRSLQPVLISFCGGWLMRDRLEIGSQWSLATVLNITIVNDLPTHYFDAQLSVCLAHETGEETPLFEVSVDIAPDSVLEPFDVTKILEGNFEPAELPEKILRRISKTVRPGYHCLRAYLHDDSGTLVSQNEYPVQWVEPVLPTTSFFSATSRKSKESL